MSMKYDQLFLLTILPRTVRVELIDGGGVIGQVGAVHGRNTIDLIQDLGPSIVARR